VKGALCLCLWGHCAMNVLNFKTPEREPRMMDRIFIRNYVLFLAALVLCGGILVFTLISGNSSISKIDESVAHTYSIITTAERLSTLVESLLGAQRAYLITGQKIFLDKYEDRKRQLSEKIAALSELTNDNPSQVSRLTEIRDYSTQLTTKLEERIAKYKPLPKISDDFLDDVEMIDNLKDSIRGLNSAILEEEYGLLNKRILGLEQQKSSYFNSLLIGVVFSSALLLLFNGILLQSQRKRNRVEASLKDTEERFRLAVEGTQDGIFDWDLTTGEIFYSRRIFAMLGYERGSLIGSPEDFRELIHPEDLPRVLKYVEDYLAGSTDEYTQEFRAKSNSGQWVWIQSRATCIIGPNGKPVRMVGAHTDISALKEREVKLEAEKQAAEESNRAKSDFLAHMSHEIRTPLTAISGIAEIFGKKQANLDEKQKKLVRTLHSSTSALKELINDILDFSKIESGELELNSEVFQLGSLFETIISMMGLRANEKGISFVFNFVDVKDASFYGDEARLRQVLINLVGNAMKFTEEGGVSVSAYVEDRQGEPYLRIDVTDTGIGIEPENFDLIFERFKQADSSVSRKYGGTGLGLPISNNLVKLMGGKIILNSQSGKGSTFSVLLPDKAGALKRLQSEQPQTHIDINEKIRSSLTKDSKILIVEDYEGNITVVGYILDDLKCAYDIARNGQEALDMWSTNTYNAILMDIQMPLMDGFTATSEIRRIEAEKSLKHTPIIGMTAHALIGDKDKCIEVGMDAYLAKPLVENELKTQILKYLCEYKKAA
jgi:PAS domain S-box-containing protein